MVHWLKAIFINVFLLASVVAAIHSWVRVVLELVLETGGGLDVSWLAAAIANTTIASVFIVYIGKGNIARTSANLPLASLIVVICAAVSLYHWPSTPLATFYASGIAGVGLFLYLFWYSKFNRKTGVMQIGEQLPEFSLQLTDGVNLQSKAIAGPSLIIFYRGNWCPLCVAQINEVVEQYHHLKEMGVDVYFVSPQSQSQSEQLAKRFSAPINFCVDAGNAAAQVLGIEHQRGLPLGMEFMGYEPDTVMPTVIILDQNARVAYLDETDNYRVRPEPEIYLDVFKSMGLV